MISADTVLNILQEGGITEIKDILPEQAYLLIKKKYIDNKYDGKPYLKYVIKKYEKKIEK